jgi:hypothetical protein
MRYPLPDHGILPPFARRRLAQALDPFGFEELLEGVHLRAEELPGLTRERRLEGLGA